MDKQINYKYYIHQNQQNRQTFLFLDQIHEEHFYVDGSDVQKTELKGLKENEYSNMFVLDEDGQFRLLTQ